MESAGQFITSLVIIMEIIIKIFPAMKTFRNYKSYNGIALTPRRVLQICNLVSLIKL